MNKVSFEEIGAVAATFFAQKEVKAGQVVKMTGNGQVGPCSAGDKFCGVALSNENGWRRRTGEGILPGGGDGSIDLGWNVLAAGWGRRCPDGDRRGRRVPIWGGVSGGQYGHGGQARRDLPVRQRGES